MDKLKLPVTWTQRGYVVDARGVYLCSTGAEVAQVIADALNATARRCDGCKHWRMQAWTLTSPPEPMWGYCIHEMVGMPEDAPDGPVRDADDWCRKGWEPR